jgi:hypothetical protein
MMVFGNEGQKHINGEAPETVKYDKKVNTMITFFPVVSKNYYNKINAAT